MLSRFWIKEPAAVVRLAVERQSLILRCGLVVLWVRGFGFAVGWACLVVFIWLFMSF